MVTIVMGYYAKKMVQDKLDKFALENKLGKPLTKNLDEGKRNEDLVSKKEV